MKLLCSIYRSPRKPGMYLYVPREKGVSEVPAPLLELFGKRLGLLRLSFQLPGLFRFVGLARGRADSDDQAEHDRGGGTGLFTGCAAGDSAGAVVVRVDS